VKQKKVPMRMCLGCNEMKPKKELLRIVKDAQGEISFDPTNKKPGRGAYICPSNECFEKAVKNKRMEKTFESKIDISIVDRLKEEMERRSGK
jgi:predicted RNA-binding protein YlxR (DUF448 family)